MADYLEILPTGDAETDTTAIEQALNTLSLKINDTTSGYYRQCTLRLSGRYNITRPLKMKDANYRPVIIDGQGLTTLVPTKNFPNNEYLLTVTGGGRCRTPLIRDLEIRCGYICRGIKIEGLSYRALIDGLRIDASIGVGLYIKRCYVSSIENVEISAKGVGIWLDGFNSAITHVKLGGYSCWNSNSAINKEQRLYECANGYEAAKNNYPGYQEAWPIELPIEQRASFILNGSNTILNQIDCETCQYCSYPLMYIKNSYGAIYGLRCENNMNSQCKIRYTGEGLTIREACIGDSEELGSGGCKTFLECVGSGGGVLIDNALMMGFRDSLVNISSAWKQDTTFNRIVTRKNVINPDNYVIPR